MFIDPSPKKAEEKERKGKRKALVLSGGGAKGAWQAGFLTVLSMLEQEGSLLGGYDYVAGVSAGALNGSLWASERDPRARIKRLFHAWNRGIQGNHSIYRSSVWRFLLWPFYTGLYETTPLKRLIDEYVLPPFCPLSIGVFNGSRLLYFEKEFQPKGSVFGVSKSSEGQEDRLKSQDAFKGQKQASYEALDSYAQSFKSSSSASRSSEASKGQAQSSNVSSEEQENETDAFDWKAYQSSRYEEKPTLQRVESFETWKKYIQASASFPFAFSPVEIEQEDWADGGIQNNIPSSFLEGQDFEEIHLVLTAPLSSKIEPRRIRSFKDVAISVLLAFFSEYSISDLLPFLAYQEKTGCVLRLFTPPEPLQAEVLSFQPLVLNRLFAEGVAYGRSLFRL